MEFRLIKNDHVLLKMIAEYRILTVTQLSALTLRSPQVIRRRLRILNNEGILTVRARGYGRNLGRPEDLIILTEKGMGLFLQGKKNPLTPSEYIADKMVESIFVDHELLVNWFRIHLIQIERVIPVLSIEYFSSQAVPFEQGSNKPPLLLERVPSNGEQEELTEFFPDGAFSITQREKEKTLLFFLEVDMGTETIASVDRNSKDVRQKIINYQCLFRSGFYKRYEGILKSNLNGFRLLFLTNTASRFTALCRLTQELLPSDFVWLTDQEKMFSDGLSGNIWARGGRTNDPPQSIVGPNFACESPIVLK